MFDVDRDGVLSRDEMHKMVVALLEVWKDNRTDILPVSYKAYSCFLIAWSGFEMFVGNRFRLVYS